MTTPASTQLTLALEGETPPPSPAKPRRTPKPHHRPKADGPLLPLTTPKFLPVVGVPKTRAECPDTSKGHCPHLRCRWHLHRLDAEHRAGRPGLGNAPRDARGLVISQEGDLGDTTAGTTATPRWMELERSAKMQLELDEEGNIVGAEPYNMVSESSMLSWVMRGQWVGTWDMMADALYIDEPIDVFNDRGERVCGAKYTSSGALVFDAKPNAIVVTLRRVRGVPSCALDEIEKHGKMTNTQIGDALDRHRTLIAREIKGASRKACQRAEDMGIDQVDFVRALMSMGEER